MVIEMSPSQVPEGEGGVTPWASLQFSAESRRGVNAQSDGQLELPVTISVCLWTAVGSGREQVGTGRVCKVHKKRYWESNRQPCC